jgi:hypothetical protein
LIQCREYRFAVKESTCHNLPSNIGVYTATPFCTDLHRPLHRLLQYDIKVIDGACCYNVSSSQHTNCTALTALFLPPHGCASTAVRCT